VRQSKAEPKAVQFLGRNESNRVPHTETIIVGVSWNPFRSTRI
jgi:hypothetical protein